MQNRNNFHTFMYLYYPNDPENLTLTLLIPSYFAHVMLFILSGGYPAHLEAIQENVKESKT